MEHTEWLLYHGASAAGSFGTRSSTAVLAIIDCLRRFAAIWLPPVFLADSRIARSVVRS